MFEDLTPEVREVLTAASAEVGRRGDRRLGTQHLLLGLLGQPASPSAGALGISFIAVRRALSECDRSALAEIGLCVRGIRLPGGPPVPKGTPWTYAARAVIRYAGEEMLRTGSRSMETRHLVLGILECKRPDPASAVLDQLEVDRTAVRNRLR